MSYRLQVLIPPQLDARLRKAAKRQRVSKGEFVRRALEGALSGTASGGAEADPVARLAAINAPTAGIERMLEEIEAGRR